VTWSVKSVRAVEPTAGADAAVASIVTLGRGDEERPVLVELARTASAAGVGFDPRDAVSKFLDDDEPPERLVVTTDGVAAG
jgi:hypothetical protein